MAKNDFLNLLNEWAVERPLAKPDDPIYYAPTINLKQEERLREEFFKALKTLYNFYQNPDVSIYRKIFDFQKRWLTNITLEMKKDNTSEIYNHSFIFALKDPYSIITYMGNDFLYNKAIEETDKDFIFMLLDIDYSFIQKLKV